MAQLVERFICNEEVRSSNLLGSTIIKSAAADFFMVNSAGERNQPLASSILEQSNARERKT